MTFEPVEILKVEETPISLKQVMEQDPMSDDSSDDENQCEELKEDQEATPIDDLISFEEPQVLQPQKNFKSRLNM